MSKACWPPFGAALLALVLTGCGAAGPEHAQRSTTRRAQHSAPPVHARPVTPGPAFRLPTPGPTGAKPDPAAVRVIRSWSDALRRGDVRRAAEFFAVPSTMINGDVTGGAVAVIKIRTRAEAELANAGLPCGARLLSADMRGRFVNALFELTGRPGAGGSSCGGGAGTTARTNFVITGDRIREWIRAPDDPGDNTSGPIT